MKALKVTLLVLLLLTCLSTVNADVKVAVVRSWGNIPEFQHLSDNWNLYGTTPLSIDTSLATTSSFTYANLVATGADVLWLSNPAGGVRQYSVSEIAAVKQYVEEGHSILGTFLCLQWGSIDNRALAPLFGLRDDISYNTTHVTAEQSFNLLESHPVFAGIPDPYVSGGYPEAQVPVDDLKWDVSDLGGAQLMAVTSDQRGIITWYQAASYHATYCSEMVEYYGNSTDMQFLYNALTIPEPATMILLSMGIFGLRVRVRIKKTSK